MDSRDRRACHGLSRRVPLSPPYLRSLQIPGRLSCVFFSSQAWLYSPSLHRMVETHRAFFFYRQFGMSMSPQVQRGGRPEALGLHFGLLTAAAQRPTRLQTSGTKVHGRGKQGVTAVVPELSLPHFRALAILMSRVSFALSSETCLPYPRQSQDTPSDSQPSLLSISPPPHLPIPGRNGPMQLALSLIHI